MLVLVLLQALTLHRTMHVIRLLIKFIDFTSSFIRIRTDSRGKVQHRILFYTYVKFSICIDAERDVLRDQNPFMFQWFRKMRMVSVYKFTEAIEW